MKQTMAIVAIILLAVGFLFIVIGYAEREGVITVGDGIGTDEDHYPPELTPDDETPPDETPPGEPPSDGDSGYYRPSPPVEPPIRPDTTINIFGFTVSPYEIAGVLMCAVGVVLFATGGKL